MSGTTEFNIEPERWARIKTKLDLIGDIGTAEHQRVTIEYQFEGRVLKVAVKKKPFFVPMTLVLSKIREEFETLCNG